MIGHLYNDKYFKYEEKDSLSDGIKGIYFIISKYNNVKYICKAETCVKKEINELSNKEFIDINNDKFAIYRFQNELLFIEQLLIKLFKPLNNKCVFTVNRKILRNYRKYRNDELVLIVIKTDDMKERYSITCKHKKNPQYILNI